MSQKKIPYSAKFYGALCGLRAGRSQIFSIYQSGIDLRGDLGLGHGPISENQKWLTYQNAKKWCFWYF